MRIDAKTLYKDVAGELLYLTEESDKRLREVAPEAVITGGYYGLTIGQLARLLDGDTLGVFPNADTEKMTVFEYMTIRGLEEFVKGYFDALKRLTLKPTEKEERASQGCVKMGSIEAMLIFARRYFELHSFAEAENVTLGDVLIAKKDSYNTMLQQRQYANICAADAKRKGKVK